MELAPELHAGLRASLARVVTEALTAEALGSGDVPVLATPAVLAMMEEAACAAIRPALRAGQTTVGTRVELEHLAPSKIGATVDVTSELTSVDGRTLEFACETREADRVVARARHARVVVDREWFLA
jgi:fluoroacetyl-CoA thioesterase